MKKLISLMLLISLTLPCFANEQSVLNEARITFINLSKGQDLSKIPQTEQDLVGLFVVAMQYLTTFQADNLIDSGNLILKKLPSSIVPNIQEQGRYMAYMCLGFGNALNFNFIEARRYLGKMSLYNGKKFDKMDCTETYNQLKGIINELEKMYIQAKNNGYDVESARTRQMIRKQLGI